MKDSLLHDIPAPAASVRAVLPSAFLCQANTWAPRLCQAQCWLKWNSGFGFSHSSFYKPSFTFSVDTAIGQEKQSAWVKQHFWWTWRKPRGLLPPLLPLYVWSGLMDLKQKVWVNVFGHMKWLEISVGIGQIFSLHWGSKNKLQPWLKLDLKIILYLFPLLSRCLSNQGYSFDCGRH